MVFDHNNHSNEIELVGSVITKLAAFDAHTRPVSTNKRKTRRERLKLWILKFFAPFTFSSNRLSEISLWWCVNWIIKRDDGMIEDRARKLPGSFNTFDCGEKLKFWQNGSFIDIWCAFGINGLMGAFPSTCSLISNSTLERLVNPFWGSAPEQHFLISI